MGRKICVVTTSYADYGRIKPVMQAIKKHPKLELQIVAGSSLFLDNLLWYFRHGEPLSWQKSLPWHFRARVKTFLRTKDAPHIENLLATLAKDGFPPTLRLPMFLEGGNLRTMVKTAGIGMVGMPDVFQKLNPDILLLHGDRFELLPIATAAAFSNIPIAHIEGGDVTGTIDNSVRHAISKLAHIHFAVTEKSRERLIHMGEDPSRIFVTGTPITDFLYGINLALDNTIYKKYGRDGRLLDFTKPFLLIVYHPVTTQYDSNYLHAKELLSALEELSFPTLFLVPNIDAGSDGVASAVREFYDKKNPSYMMVRKRYSPEDYSKLLANAAVAVGNSSSFIREAAFLGTPSVLVGDRQEGRERGDNSIEVGNQSEEIIRAVKKQLVQGRYPRDMRFGDGRSAERIVSVLAGIDTSTIPLQKRFYEPEEKKHNLS